MSENLSSISCSNTNLNIDLITKDVSNYMSVYSGGKQIHHLQIMQNDIDFLKQQMIIIIEQFEKLQKTLIQLTNKQTNADAESDIAAQDFQDENVSIEKLLSDKFCFDQLYNKNPVKAFQLRNGIIIDQQKNKTKPITTQMEEILLKYQAIED